MQKSEMGGREGEPTRGERVWRAHLFPRCGISACTASYRPFLSKETPTAIRDT